MELSDKEMEKILQNEERAAAVQVRVSQVSSLMAHTGDTLARGPPVSGQSVTLLLAAFQSLLQEVDGE